ncbi:MAG: hypothetical protein GC193_02005 [Cryomorphaceae bacterium]|nr:hypothetical protein [Cryomorphaceae bacterium]
MKHLLTFAFFALIGMGASAQVSITDEKIAATITPETTRMELANMRVELIAAGVEIRYTDIKWDSNNKLISINFIAKNDAGNIGEYHASPLQADQSIKMVSNRQNGEICVGLNCE